MTVKAKYADFFLSYLKSYGKLWKNTKHLQEIVSIQGRHIQVYSMNITSICYQLMRLKNIVIINALFPSIWLIHNNLPIVVYVNSIATWGNASSWMKCEAWAQRAGICTSTLLVSCYVLDNWRKVKIWRQKNKTELSVRDRRQDTRQCLETQKSGLYCKTDATKWKWDWTLVAYVRLHKADEIQGRSEGGGGAGETWAEAQRLKEFIGRSSKDSRVSGRLEYLAGYCGESPTKSGSH